MRSAFALVASVLLVTAGCGPEAPKETISPDNPITVFAAASLKDAFTELGKQFEAEHGGVNITFNFAGSSDLVAQIQQGAPADVFASADTTNMDKAVADDLVAGSPLNFASNTLQIATPPDNPAKVDSIDDLAAPGIKVVLCAEQVPCGSAAKQVEEASDVDIKPVSEEPSVADVLGKIISGEADAGLVYVTDVRAAGDKVNGIEFPESAGVVNTYPVAALRNSQSPDLAKVFAVFVASDRGQAVLAEAGFGAP